MNGSRRRKRLPGVSARLRLALSYALFLVAAGFVVLVGIYGVFRYVPNYPLTVATPRPGDSSIAVVRSVSRGETLAALVRVSGLILGGLAVIGISGGWIIAGWVLSPLQAINEAAQIAATGRLDHRIRLGGLNDEFRQLADTFDFMLDRLHDAFRTQERFAANASHELRTPLTVIATLLDVARRNPDEQDYAMLIERLSITNARAIGLTESLLRLADANSITATSEPVDLALIARAAISGAAAEAERFQVSIDTCLKPAPTFGDAVLLEQLATNLIQNAIRHNHWPGSAHVHTNQAPRRRTVTLRVENSGDLYTPDQAARLTEPFLRGSGRTSRPGREKGYGLGLALVSQITMIHGGSLTIAPRDGGGLVVAVTLPSDGRGRTKRGATAPRRRSAAR